jgi:hypothetical protein
MKMRILHWLYGKKRGEKKEKERQEKEKQEKYEKMPNFRKVFVSLPNIIKAVLIPEDIETQHDPSVQDRAAAKSVADKATKATADKNKIDEVYTRIETVKSKNLEIIWLLQTNKDVPYKSLRELIESYRNVKDDDSYRGMSVNWAQKGKLHEISPLNEHELDGLAKKLEC